MKTHFIEIVEEIKRRSSQKMKLIAGMFFKYHGDDKKVETKCETLILMYLLVILINQS